MGEFSNSRRINFTVQVDKVTDPNNAQYDFILEADIMSAIGIDIKYSTAEIQWDDMIVPMKSFGMLQCRDTLNMAYEAATKDPILQQVDDRHKNILDADYSKVDIEEMVEALKLSPITKKRLIRTLKKFPDLFGGGLGRVNVDPVNIGARKDAKPQKSKAYPIPRAYEGTTKKEIKRLCEIGVLERTTVNTNSPWVAPTFIQQNKTGDVRILTDLRKVNENIERKPFPLPKISELIGKMERFKSATALDLSQGYYSIPIDEESQELCTTVLPWGTYKYK